MKRERIGGVLLLILGVLTLGTGAYFLFFRPALLPEDLRFTGADPRLIDARMAIWLGLVFRTWGGFMAGFGILLSAVAGTILSARQEFLRWGAAAAIILAFGSFLASNLQLRSDSVTFIVALFAIAVASASLLLMSRRRRGGGDA